MISLFRVILRLLAPGALPSVADALGAPEEARIFFGCGLIMART